MGWQRQGETERQEERTRERERLHVRVSNSRNCTAGKKVRFHAEWSGSTQRVGADVQTTGVAAASLYQVAFTCTLLPKLTASVTL
jgi:hypothetical protein